jgi:hypothetical protein
VRERVYTLYPPEATAWAIGQGLPQPPPAPEALAAGDAVGTEAGVAAPIEVVSPFQGDRFRISNALPRNDQRLLVEARVGSGVAFARVTLHVDDRVLAEFDAPPYQAWWALEPGEHGIRAVGESTAGEQVVSEAIMVYVSGGE